MSVRAGNCGVVADDVALMTTAAPFSGTRGVAWAFLVLSGFAPASRFSKDYDYRVQTSATMIDVTAIRLVLNRLAPA